MLTSMPPRITLFDITQASGHPYSATTRQSKIEKTRITSEVVHPLDFVLFEPTAATMEDASTKLSCSTEPLANNDFVHVFFPTLGLIAFTLALEALSHGTLTCSTISGGDDANNVHTDERPHRVVFPAIVAEQPRPEVPPVAAASSSASEQSPVSAQEKTPTHKPSCCLPNVSPNVRANRLITAIFLYAGILAFFIIRMRDVRIPHLRPECANYVSIYRASDKMPVPNWWWVLPLNILPFVCASFSLLRTVVDCVLVRWGQGLDYGETKANNTWAWPVCMPLKALWFLPYITIKVLMVYPIACMMGRPMSTTWSSTIPKTQRARSDDIEMQSEEMTRLVDDVDGVEEAEERPDSPPAYDEAVREREHEVRESQ